MTNNNVKQTFVKKTPFDVMRKLRTEENWWASKLAMHLNTSSNHVSDVLQKLKVLDLVEAKDDSEYKREIILTERGKEIAAELDRAQKVFEEVENNE